MRRVKWIILFLGCVNALAADPSTRDALAKLQAGNDRYVSGATTHPDQGAEQRKDLAKGQTPFVTILSCSDSRVAPEIIFDQGLGDIFSIRVAGNVAGTDEIGTIEYGAGHLHTPLLVVLGHTKCGAVSAAVSGAELHGSLLHLVAQIEPAVKEAKAATGAKGDELLEAAVVQNVRNSIADILHRSDEVRTLVAEDKLKVIGAVYNLETGKVKWLGDIQRAAEVIGAK